LRAPGEGQEWISGPGEGEGSLVLELEDGLASRLRRLARAWQQAPEALAAKLLLRGLEQLALRAHAEAILDTLTPREQQVAWQALRGRTNGQIAEALVISTETVKTHIRHVLEKFGVRSKADLRLLLLDLGLRWWETAQQGDLAPLYSKAIQTQEPPSPKE
jgi:DNA-binding CsgD family transcriptional regulator